MSITRTAKLDRLQRSREASEARLKASELAAKAELAATKRELGKLYTLAIRYINTVAELDIEEDANGRVLRLMDSLEAKIKAI